MGAATRGMDKGSPDTGALFSFRRLEGDKGPLSAPPLRRQNQPPCIPSRLS